MDKIAFIIGETFLYWNSIFLVLGALSAAMLFLAFYLGRSGNAIAGFLYLPLSIGLSVLLARLVHWYCHTDSYGSLHTAITNFLSGGYALCGAFAGCFLAAVLLRLANVAKDLPELLDCACLAGAGGISVGRLACFFTNADRGAILDSSWGFPFTWPTINSVTGESENRMAIFLFQALLCGCFLLILTVFWLSTRKKHRNGDTCLLFLLLYGASQAILDSMRYDSLFLRSNGFVSLVQILGAAAVVLPVIVFSVRSVRAWRLRVWHILLWLIAGGALGGAGYMEYYVQRHGNLALFCYSVMSVCMAAVILIALTFYSFGGSRAKPK